MDLFKRYIAAVLAISTLLMCMVTNVSAEEQSENTVKAEISQYEYLLEAIDIIDIDENYQPNDTITKIEFIKALISMMKIDVDIYDMNKQIFIDVPLTDANAKYANCAFKMGITNGYEDGNLGVNDSINLVDATTMICRVMGYQKIADLQGGYPNGYTKLASALDLYNNLNIVGGTLRNVDAAYMIYNALSAPMFEMSYGDSSYKLKDSSTLFGVLFDLSYVIGVVQEDSYGSILSSDKSDDGELLIDGLRYDIPEKFSYGFLGKRVKAYYTGKDDDTKEIIYMFATSDNKILNLTSKDVESLDAQELSYDSNENGKIRTADISPYAITIKNGNIFKIGNDTKVTVKNGTYTLIDNDGNGEYDIIIIKDYRTVVVEDLSIQLNSIYDVADGKPALLLDDYDEVIITDTEGKKLELKDIQKDAVLRVEAAENKRCIRITVVYNTKEGSVAKINTERGYQGEYYVYGLDNGEELTTSIELENFISHDSIKLGVQYKFLLDTDGKAVYARKLADVLRFGWLKACKIDNGFGDTVSVKIFTTDGKFEIYSFSNKVKLNGSKVNINTFMKKWNNTEQLVRYKASDDNVLTEIETEANEGAVSGFKLKASLPASSSSYTTRYYSGPNLIGGKIALDNNTVVFGIPEDGEDENYQTGGRTYVVNQGYYPLAKGYSDVSKKGEFVDCLVIPEKEKELDVNDTNTAIMLVKEIENRYDTKEECLQKVLCGYTSTEYVEYTFRNSIEPSYTTSTGVTVPVEKGDVVWLGYDTNKKINIIKVFYDKSTGNRYGNNDGNDENVEFGYRMKLNYGTPYSVSDGYFRYVPINADSESGYMYPVTTVYQYDETKRDDNVITAVTGNELETLSNNPGLKDKVLLVTNYQMVRLVVVYKEY